MDGLGFQQSPLDWTTYLQLSLSVSRATGQPEVLHKPLTMTLARQSSELYLTHAEAVRVVRAGQDFRTLSWAMLTPTP